MQSNRHLPPIHNYIFLKKLVICPQIVQIKIGIDTKLSPGNMDTAQINPAMVGAEKMMKMKY